MLVIKINRSNYEYDVNSLVKSFYPEETVGVLTPDVGEKKRVQMEPEVGMELEMEEAYASFSCDRKWIRSHEPEEELNGTDEDGCLHWKWEYDPAGPDTYKYGVKSFLYRILCKITGSSLPWGELVGIRPTKIAYGMLEEGKSGDEIRDYMQEHFFVSVEKSALSVEIAALEREILSGIHYENGYSLYIGIPFCPTTCLYCSFTSFPVAAYRTQVDAYLDCVIRELEFTAQSFRDRILDSVYIGGGTPTTLEPAQLERLLGKIRTLFDFDQVREFTVEAGRPDSITPEKLEVLKRFGVTRISVNPQTMNQKTLDMIGRRHTVEQVEEAFFTAREEGFDNINMDLILGLPGETPSDISHTVERIKALGPDSLTVHSLAVKRASRLSKWIQENGVSSIRNTDETMAIAAKGAKDLGMNPYYLYRQKNMSGNFENVGYARPGKYGLYNILIMEERQTIVALGAGSITKLVTPDGRIERCENVKDVRLYMDETDEMIKRKRDLFAEVCQ